MNIIKTMKFLVIGALLTLACAIPMHTDAKLLLMPTYAVFEDRGRTQDITIVNTSDETSIYRMGWIHYTQKEDGTYDRLEQPLSPQFDPETMIVFSPRQVTLPPKARQRIRMSLRRPPDLPNGEYRGHLKLQNIGKADSVARNQAAEGVTTEVAVNVGFAMPVIVRQGTYDASVSITNPSFSPPPSASDQRPRLKVTLNRTGLHGTMGRLLAYWAPPGQEERQIGTLNNVNIFSETRQRTANIPLTEINVNSGTLRIVYEGVGADKNIIFDEAVLPIGG
jgi:fimbrial chaperone protein